MEGQGATDSQTWVRLPPRPLKVKYIMSKMMDGGPEGYYYEGPNNSLETTEIKKNKCMEKNEIKKLLYRENPIAVFNYIRKGNAYYQTKTIDVIIDFVIPVSDMGEANFLNEMDSKSLIRWIV